MGPWWWEGWGETGKHQWQVCLQTKADLSGEKKSLEKSQTGSKTIKSYPPPTVAITSLQFLLPGSLKLSFLSSPSALFLAESSFFFLVSDNYCLKRPLLCSFLDYSFSSQWTPAQQPDTINYPQKYTYREKTAYSASCKGSISALCDIVKG